MAAVYRKHPQTAGRIVDELAFVVTAHDNKLHTLNRSASFLWKLCEDGLTIEEAALALQDEFVVKRDDAEINEANEADEGDELDIETARVDARECLDGLVSRSILIVEE